MGSNMDKIYIVMNYVEHDLKSLMETMKQPFLPGGSQSVPWGDPGPTSPEGCPTLRLLGVGVWGLLTLNCDPIPLGVHMLKRPVVAAVASSQAPAPRCLLPQGR